MSDDDEIDKLVAQRMKAQKTAEVLENGQLPSGDGDTGAGVGSGDQSAAQVAVKKTKGPKAPARATRTKTTPSTPQQIAGAPVVSNPSSATTNVPDMAFTIAQILLIEQLNKSDLLALCEKLGAECGKDWKPRPLAYSLARLHGTFDGLEVSKDGTVQYTSFTLSSFHKPAAA